jgi:hypothetical protein
LLNKTQKSRREIFKLCSHLGISFNICSGEQFNGFCPIAIPAVTEFLLLEVFLHVGLTAAVGNLFQVDVRFTPNSDHESGIPAKAMSALPPKADMCGATRDVCFGSLADILRCVRYLLRRYRPSRVRVYRMLHINAIIATTTIMIK